MRRLPIALTVLTALTLSSGLGLAQVCELDEVGSVGAEGTLSVPVVINGIAYVAAGSSGLVWIDITDPTDMTVLGSLATSGQTFDLFLDYFGERLMVADGNFGAGVYAIGADGSLTETGLTNLDETVISVGGSSGRFFAGTQEGSLFALDADAADDPAVVGSLALGGQVRAILEHSRYAYCALGSGGLAMVNVQDRSAMSVVDTIDLGGNVYGIARVDQVLYCGVEGVGLVSVSIQGESLVPAGALTLDDVPTHIFAWLGRAYLVGPQLGVAVADVTLPGNPLLLGQLELDGADGLSLVSGVLFVGRGAQGLAAVDVSDCASVGTETTTSFIAAAARSEGGYGSFWVTDAAFCNLTGKSASFNLAYLVKGQANTAPANASFTLQPGEQLLVSDVFATLLGLDAGNGALRVVASHPDLKITTRTYNAAGVEGTYGQFIPAFTRFEALEPGDVGILLQLQQNIDFRSNIGLLNLKAEAVELEIELYIGTGNLVGVVNETLDPFEMIQIDQIYTTVGAGRVDSGYALVKVLTGGGQILAYASVADNGSGDAIYVAAQKLSYPSAYTD